MKASNIGIDLALAERNKEPGKTMHGEPSTKKSDADFTAFIPPRSVKNSLVKKHEEIESQGKLKEGLKSQFNKFDNPRNTKVTASNNNTDDRSTKSSRQCKIVKPIVSEEDVNLNCYPKF